MFVLGIMAIFLIFAWLTSTGICLAMIIECDIDELEDAFNPIAMYDNSNLNVFGVIALTIIGYILCLPMAAVYWFYKLCTVGRR